MTRVLSMVLVTVAALATPLAAEAQSPAKVPRIGYLESGAPGTPLVEAFRDGLRDLGWIEGQSIAVEVRAAEGKYDRLPALAAELVRLKVDVIFASSTPAALAAKRATTTIPIVIGRVADPVGSGLSPGCGSTWTGSAPAAWPPTCPYDAEHGALACSTLMQALVALWLGRAQPLSARRAACGSSAWTAGARGPPTPTGCVRRRDDAACVYPRFSAAGRALGIVGSPPGISGLPKHPFRHLALFGRGSFSRGFHPSVTFGGCRAV
jgi:ABC transporter substrate binding protein